VSGYNFLLPDLSRQHLPYLVLPVMSALQELGHTPVTMEMAAINEMYNQLRYQRHGCYEIFQFYVNDLVKKGKIDFGFSAGLYIVLEDATKQEAHHLLEECGIPNIVYLHSRDTSVIARLHEVGARDWRHTFLACSSKTLADQLGQSGLERAQHVAPGASVRLFYPQDQPPANAAFPLKPSDERLARGYDVSFAGSYGVRREELLLALVEAGLRVAVFGDEQWRQSRLSEQWRSQAHYLNELNTVYNASQINLDLPHDGTRLDDYVSCRLGDCLSAQGFLLAHARPGLAEQLVIEREIAVFEDEAELVKLAQYYLDNEAERLAVARRGHQRIQAEGSWTRRIEGLIPQLEMHLLSAAV